MYINIHKIHLKDCTFQVLLEYRYVFKILVYSRPTFKLFNIKYNLELNFELSGPTTIFCRVPLKLFASSNLLLPKNDFFY